MHEELLAYRGVRARVYDACLCEDGISFDALGTFVAEGRTYHRSALLRQRHGEIETGSNLVRIKRAFEMIGEADKVMLRMAVKTR